MPPIQKDITGEKYNRLTAVRFFEHRSGLPYWLFKCDCGNEVIYRKNNVTSKKGKTKSCGCLNRENSSIKGKKFRTHGMSETKFYYVWKSMKNRCQNPKVREYKYYGRRGIQVRWDSFEEFMDDMYEGYLEHTRNNEYTSIDRIDVNGNYCKENCRWADMKTQLANMRKK